MPDAAHRMRIADRTAGLFESVGMTVHRFSDIDDMMRWLVDAADRASR